MSRNCNGEEDAIEIIPNLWLGNYKIALNKNFLTNNKIKYIINITKDIPNLDIDNINYLNIKINDIDTCYKNLNNIFEICYNYIYNAIKNNKSILIHCQKGHHRSATIIAAFLLKYLKLDYITVLTFINSKRKCALTRNSCMTIGLYKYYLDLY